MDVFARKCCKSAKTVNRQGLLSQDPQLLKNDFPAHKPTCALGGYGKATTHASRHRSNTVGYILANMHLL